MTYIAASDRYKQLPYRRCGRSGLQLPAISLGLWQNFGDDAPFRIQRAIIRRAFDLGVTHFDLANNYGPDYGAAERNFGRIMREDLRPYRDELIISTKAGYDMWPGPYGDWGSRKYLLASLDQSLARSPPAAPCTRGFRRIQENGRGRRRPCSGRPACRC
jgi:L-glyceraldehyde 3-phosphate reductase